MSGAGGATNRPRTHALTKKEPALATRWLVMGCMSALQDVEERGVDGRDGDERGREPEVLLSGERGGGGAEDHEGEHDLAGLGGRCAGPDESGPEGGDEERHADAQQEAGDGGAARGEPPGADRAQRAELEEEA